MPFSPGSTSLVAALALLVLLAGCGGGSDSAQGGKPPAGFRVYRGPDFDLAYPASWGAVTDRPALSGPGHYYQVLAPGPKRGMSPQIGLGRGRASGAFARVVDLNKVDEKFGYPHWRLVGERDIDVPGAEQAHEIETTYLLSIAGGPPTPTREVQVLLRTPNGIGMDLLVRAPEQQFDSVPLRKVISAFRVR